jgi:regulator of protease activity HflC (stomatin/prohibitin superfamily)
MLWTLFRSAGATGHVFLLKGGKTDNKGLAFSGLIGPMTTVAVVPTIPQFVSFAIAAKTKDLQVVTVQGNLTVSLIPEKAVTVFDFTVNPKTGSYITPWDRSMNARMIEQVLRIVLAKIKELDIAVAVQSQKQIEDAITNALGGNMFAAEGLTVTSCSIPKIQPQNAEIDDALGAKERQAMLVESDRATHDRRIQQVTNDRAVRQFEADTELALEKAQAELIKERAKNGQAEARADAAATKTRLAPLADVDAGKIIGAAILKAAEGGQLSSLNITSEFLAAVGSKD